MIAVTTIEVEAFKNFAEKTVLRIGDLASGLHFVRGVNRSNARLGSNGAGKSSFFSDAVSWCLYGQTVGGLRTTDIKSWLAKAPPRVAVTVRKGKTAHVVQRGPRASALTIDGRVVGQAEVDALIGLDFAAFAQAVIWGQGQPLFFDLAPRDKMQLLSDALGLERWERRAQAAADRARRLGATLQGVSGELTGLEAAREHAEAAQAEAREASGEWGASHARKLEELAGAASAARGRADQIEARRGEAALAGDKAGTAAKLLRPAVEAAQAKIDEAGRARDDADRALDQAASELRDAKEHLASFAEEGACPTCGQAVTKKDAAAHASALGKKIATLEADIKSTKRAKAAAERIIEALEASLARDEAELRGLTEVEARAASDLRVLDRELATAQAQAASAWQAHKDAEGEENPHRDAAARARRRLSELKSEIGALSTRVEKIEASIERAQFWARGFRDIRLMVIDEVLADLQEMTAAVLEDLGLGDWAVTYSTERETKSGTTQRALSVAVRSPATDGDVRWESYSGGERQRLRLAGALALSEVLMSHAGADLDFRVLDEPAVGMGGSGVDDLCEMLADYARDAGLKIFLIDHLARKGASFGSTVTVTGGPGGARVRVD